MRYGPVIVVEGPDGTGKTTLARHIEREYGFRYLHRGPPETDAWRYYLDGLREHEGPVVTDRLHAGSWAYGHAFRNGPDMTDFEAWLLEGWMVARGAALVYAIVPPEVVDGNLARGPDSPDAVTYEVPEKRAELRRLFEEFVSGVTALRVYRYDFTDGGMEETARKVVQHVQYVSALAPAADAGIIGCTTTPRLIFVGEQPHGYAKTVQRFKRRGPEKLARALRFIARRREDGTVFNSVSGRYLHQCLRAARLTLNDYCVLNSLQWDGRTVEDLVDADRGWWEETTCEGTQIVALGNVAAERLDRTGLPFRRAPHPQFVKRFHYKRVLDYAAVLLGERPYKEEEWRTS